MFEEILEIVKRRVVSRGEFYKLIDRINDSDAEVHIKYSLHDSVGEVFTYGRGREEPASNTFTFKLKNPYTVEVQIWQKDDILSNDFCKTLFKEFWNHEMCNDTSGLQTSENDTFCAKCDITMAEWSEQGKIAVVMMDLDNMREVNNSTNHNRGSEIIKTFAEIVFRNASKDAVVIHQSGDEFNIVFKYDDYITILDQMYSIYNAVIHDEKLKVIDKPLTMSIGIWLVDNGEDFNLRNLRTTAEDVYLKKGKNDVKQRNSIRIDKNDNKVDLSKCSNTNYKLAFSRVLGNVRNTNLFHNVYLDFIAQQVSKCKVDKIQGIVNSLLEWINADEGDGLRVTTCTSKWDTKAQLSKGDIAFSVFQGILRNEEIIGQKISIKVDEQYFKIQVNNNEVFQRESGINEFRTDWKCDKYEPITEKIDVRKVLLVKAGYQPIEDLPEDLFGAIVRVDSRPSIGGGLPDFWEAGLAEIIFDLEKKPNITNIILTGDIEHTKRIYKYINTINDWSDNTKHYIARKTFKSERQVNEIANKISDRKIVLSTSTQIIDYIFDTYKNGLSFIESEETLNRDREKYFLKRDLHYKDTRLKKSDGCRVDTIRKAYPMVLEILRNAKSKRKMIDQARRELIELTDFKIVLRNPKDDLIPEYYKGDDEEIKSYYQGVFGEKGLFTSNLNKYNQISSMIEHVKQAITGENFYSTRRALLVIQNEGESESNYSPYGLVSIWLAPRYINEENTVNNIYEKQERNVVIDFSYTWRTVEALVGLPYSMYGSVEFAGELVKKIKDKVNDPDIKISLGEVTYIAYSLHMFTDNETKEIVRGIINEVSM